MIYQEEITQLERHPRQQLLWYAVYDAYDSMRKMAGCLGKPPGHKSPHGPQMSTYNANHPA